SLRVTSLNAQYIDHSMIYPATAPRTAEPISVKVSVKLTSNPVHNNGIVISLGSNWVSISMNARAIIAQVKPSAANAAKPYPKCQAIYPLVVAVNSSTTG